MKQKHEKEVQKLIDSREMTKLYEFIFKYKNMLMASVLFIALLIVGINWYGSEKDKTQKLIAEKLFAVQKVFTDKDYDKVITLGIEYADKFSSYSQSRDIVILVAKAYVKQNKPLEAISILEKSFKDSEKKDLSYFSMGETLGGLYLDQWSKDKESSEMASNAANIYHKLSQTSTQKEKYLYLEANAYHIAGKKESAKNIVAKIFSNKSKLSYDLRQKVEKLNKHLQ